MKEYPQVTPGVVSKKEVPTVWPRASINFLLPGRWRFTLFWNIFIGFLRQAQVIYSIAKIIAGSFILVVSVNLTDLAPGQRSWLFLLDQGGYPFVKNIKIIAKLFINLLKPVRWPG